MIKLMLIFVQRICIGICYREWLWGLQLLTNVNPKSLTNNNHIAIEINSKLENGYFPILFYWKTEESINLNEYKFSYIKRNKNKN
jgi:hypothetical protein